MNPPALADAVAPMSLWQRVRLTAGLTPKYVREQARVVASAAQRFEVSPERLAAGQVLEFLAGVSSSVTRATYFSAFKAWFDWCFNNGVVTTDPMSGIPRPKTPKRKPRSTPIGDLEAVLASTSPQPRTVMMILLASRNGLRTAEIAQINGGDIDWATWLLTIQSKGQREHIRELDPYVVAWALKHPAIFVRRGWWFPSSTNTERGHMSAGSVSARVSAAFRRVGSRATAHQLRHLYGTQLVRAGIPTRVVQELMRHRNLRDTEAYVDVFNDQLTAAMLALPPPPGLGIEPHDRETGAMPDVVRPALSRRDKCLQRRSEYIVGHREDDGTIHVAIPPAWKEQLPQRDHSELPEADQIVIALRESGTAWAAISRATRTPYTTLRRRYDWVS
jgi:integrase